MSSALGAIQPQKLPILDYLQRQLDGTLSESDFTHMHYPTAISQTMNFRLVAVGHGTAALQLDADPAVHGNQQGTVHGGLLGELADATIGTAHSTLMGENESFTSLDLRINFLRPVWRARLTAMAWASHQGRTISHYRCEIRREEDDKVVATAESVVMTLHGQAAIGR